MDTKPFHSLLPMAVLTWQLQSRILGTVMLRSVKPDMFTV